MEESVVEVSFFFNVLIILFYVFVPGCSGVEWNRSSRLVGHGPRGRHMIYSAAFFWCRRDERKSSESNEL